jgi:hypothetical protein
MFVYSGMSIKYFQFVWVTYSWLSPRNICTWPPVKNNCSLLYQTFNKIQSAWSLTSRFINYFMLTNDLRELHTCVSKSRVTVRSGPTQTNNCFGIIYSSELRAGWSGVRVTTGPGNFSLHHRVQTGSGAHAASYPMGTRGSFPGG